MERKNKTAWPLARLKRSFLTFAAALLAISAAVGILGADGSPRAVPASAGAEKGIVYAVSYRNLDTRGGLALLESDIAAFKKRGLGFILPAELGSPGGGAMLILEDGDPRKSAEILEKNGAKAVLALREGMTPEEEEAALSFADAGLFALAAPFRPGCGAVGLFENLAEAGRSAALRLGRRIGIFLAEAPGEDLACFRAGCGGAERTFILLFGNGRNEPPFRESGIVVLNRVMRLPEWTLAEFFAEIAVPRGG